MIDDKELIEQGMNIILGMDGNDADRQDASEVFIQLVRQHDRERLREAVESVHNPCQAVSTPAFLRIRNDVLAIIDEVYKVEKPHPGEKFK